MSRLEKKTQLLINAANIGIDDVVALVNQYHGAAFPAHIDRSAYSVFSTLGQYRRKPISKLQRLPIMQMRFVYSENMLS